MPRKDVPYGGGICRLKERLPSAAVSSVNGKTGAVVLNAGDIPTRGNANVQTDIDVGKADLNNCIANIITEREARENADAALQTNINAARASIPEMSIVPDPYKGIERDAQGRAFAADPASGATDKTLVTANWVSQTGEGKPNNLIHANGTEIIFGTKIYQSPLRGNAIQLRTQNMDVTTPKSSNEFSNAIVWTDENNIALCKLWIRQRPDGRIALGLDIKKSDNTWDYGHIIYEST